MIDRGLQEQAAFSLIRALKSIDFIFKNGYNINIPHFFFCNFNTHL